MYRWMIVIGMIIIMEFSLSSAWAFTPTSPASWSNAQRVGSDVHTDYRFRSTSPVLGGGQTSYSGDEYMPGTRGPMYGPRQKGYWDENGDWVPEEGDNELGTVTDPAPVGEPYILLLMAAAYFLFIRRRKKI